MIHELVGIRDNTAVLTSAKVPEQYRWASLVAARKPGMCGAELQNCEA